MGPWTSLVVQWLRIPCSPVRGHGFNPQSRKIPRAEGQLSLNAASAEAHASWSRGAAQGEATAVRSPAARADPPLSATGEKSGGSKEDPAQPQINKQCEARALAEICAISTFLHSGSRAFPVRNEKSLIWGLILGFPHLPNLLTAFSVCFWGSDSKSAVT